MGEDADRKLPPATEAGKLISKQSLLDALKNKIEKTKKYLGEPLKKREKIIAKCQIVKEAIEELPNDYYQEFEQLINGLNNNLPERKFPNVGDTIIDNLGKKLRIIGIYDKDTPNPYKNLIFGNPEAKSWMAGMNLMDVDYEHSSSGGEPLFIPATYVFAKNPAD